MSITEVNPEAIDPIEAKLLEDFSEVKILVVEANARKIHIKANTKVTIIKTITTMVLMVNTTTHVEAKRHQIHQGNNYGQFRGRSCGRGRANYHGCGLGRSYY